METNRKILKVGIVLIAVLVVIGYVGVYLLRLDEPVVIEHYIEEQTYFAYQQSPRKINVELYYIANSTDDRVVSRIDFPEHPDLQVPASEFGMHGQFAVFTDGQQQTPGNIEGRYSIRTVYLEFAFDEDYQEGESIEITEAEIHLSDGSVFTAEIGSINFHFEEEHSNTIEFLSSSGSNYQTVTEFIVEEEIELVGIESEFLTLIQENLEMRVNGKNFQEIQGMIIEAGEKISIESNIKSSEIVGEKFRYLQLRPKIRFIKENGEEETAPTIAGWYHRQEYDFYEIFQYLQLKGAL